MSNEKTIIPLSPKEVKKKFGISQEKLARYRRDGYIKEVGWSPGSRFNEEGEPIQGMALYDPEDVIRAFHIIVKGN